MRKQIGIMLIFGAFLVLIPCITFLNTSQVKSDTATSDSVKILFTESGKVEEISTEDYMIGAVLAQMPADFEQEALKAQAVLAHTYILRRQMTENDSPDKSLKGADISDDTSLYQGYFTEEQAKEFYGKDYDSAYKAVSKAVKAVKNQILTYDSQPIIVAFHAISCGKTQSAKDIWGEDIPYLVSVDSSVDKEIEGFEKVTELSADQIDERLKSVFPEDDFSKIGESLEITSVTDSGAVLTIDAGGNEISGTDFAQALSLPSPCFTIETEGDTYTFTTKGYGHLIGMSQHGANLMAQQGKTYDEILEHYFTGSKVVKKQGQI